VQRLHQRMCADAPMPMATMSACRASREMGTIKMRYKTMHSSNRAFCGLAIVSLIIALMMYMSLGV